VKGEDGSSPYALAGETRDGRVKAKRKLPTLFTERYNDEAQEEERELRTHVPGFRTLRYPDPRYGKDSRTRSKV